MTESKLRNISEPVYELRELSVDGYWYDVVRVHDRRLVLRVHINDAGSILEHMNAHPRPEDLPPKPRWEMRGKNIYDAKTEWLFLGANWCEVDIRHLIAFLNEHDFKLPGES